MTLRFIIVLAVLTLGGCSNNDPSRMGGSPAPNDVGGQIPLPPAAPGETLLQLVWQPNNDGVVAGYRVYYGPSGDDATTQASDLALTAANFNPQSPAIAYNAQRDLGLATGQTVCFRLRAYNSQGALSAWSAPACATI